MPKTPERVTSSEHEAVDLAKISTTPRANDTKDTVDKTKSASQPTSSAVISRPIPQSPSRPKRKKALLIGINYFGDPNQLLGCINDTRDVFGFINGYFGFRFQDTILLTDDQIYEDKRPTGANIRYWMKWLVKDAEPQDSLFFHYAGHGGRIKDFSYNGKAEHLGDEADGYDEIIYPCDYLRSGIISDDEMYDLMVKDLPAGVQLTALVDACHSGTMLDLPYIYNGNHVTALEKVTRTKVGAMATMCADNLQIDPPGSTVQTQTTTTTTTTYIVTNDKGEVGVTEVTSGVMTQTPSLPPPGGPPPINTKEGGSILIDQGQCIRSISESEKGDEADKNMMANDAGELALQVTIMDADGGSVSTSTLTSSTSTSLSVPSDTKSVVDVPILDDDHQGMTSVSLHESSPSLTVEEKLEMQQIITVEEKKPEMSQTIVVEEKPEVVQPTAVQVEEEEEKEGMEEAHRMAMFRATKGNVVMFSGCRDDQASADIRASSKDAAIISSHQAAVAAANGAAVTNWSSPTGLGEADGLPNPLGYSLPQPYTSPMARGAVSYAWIQCLSQKPNQTYEELLMSMRYFMKQRDLEQIPQLGSGMPMDMRAIFTL
ncbi:Ca(2+)-dependent cysteine protease [Modicella reniformis]|uniref:Ca(2+)-dependent cysteine protease n=1 Tax=Modicella reniformis TaxID=1440133 RepID=A0A9P6MFK8_9FUNG|nr:Ca(2+)-dependent cysteine protease [Modicella reniformis]